MEGYKSNNNKSNMEIKEKVIAIVAKVCGVEESVITLESSIGDFPGWDSMGHLTILSTVEEDLDVAFEPEEMMEIEDVSDIIKAVETKLN